jgi:hypothetical protein
MRWGTICHLVRNCLETDGGSLCSILAVDIWKKTKSAMIRRSSVRKTGEQSMLPG